MRIVIGSIRHETNTFSTVRTDLECFKERSLLEGEVLYALEGTNTVVGGFIEAAETEDFELIPTLHAGAMPGGVVTREAFDYLLARLLQGVRDAEEFEGILLVLHGAMVAEGHDDGEGAILQAVRETVGPTVPIVSTLDLHANITPLMVRSANILVGYDEYPHTDMRARGKEAGRLIARLVRGEIRPTAALEKPPMMPTSQRMITAQSPMKEIMALAHRIEQDPRVLNVTVAGGFPLADFAETGFGALVTTDNNLELAKKKAKEVADLAWEMRRGFLGGTVSIDEGVQQVLEAVEGPIVLVDVADNPATGGPGDGTSLLRGLVDGKVKNAGFAVIADPDAVERAIAAGVGSRLTLQVGGKAETLYGEPVEVTGQVRRITDGQYRRKGPMMTGVLVQMGRTVVLDCDGLELILCELKQSPYSLEVFRSQGIEPTEKKILAIKGKGHFRAAFAPIAKAIILAEGKGTCGSERCIRGLPYKKVRRPIFPLDDL